MRYRLSTCALIGLGALWLTSCSTSRTATSEVSSLRVQDSRARDSVVVRSVEVHDTLCEVTTITVDRNDKGDTLRQSIVTDRYRGRDAQQLKAESSRLRVEQDTVYIEKRDSVMVERHLPSVISQQTSSFSHLLKWVFWIICAIIVLMLVLRFGRH